MTDALQLPATDTDVWKMCADKTRKLMYVLYDNPSDFPGKWVARLFLCDIDPDCRPRGTRFCEIAGTREEIEDALPYRTRGIWKFYPEFDPGNPQIIGTYRL